LRAVDLRAGAVFVVSDLHGDWAAYAAYRDLFLSLLERGRADTFVLLGDMIHSYGPPDTDASLYIVLDVMRLRRELGPSRLIALLGNHEMPHIYGIPLSKGDFLFSPRFEAALAWSGQRQAVIEFFKSLPFMVRTAGGVLLVHAGASADAATPRSAEWLLDFDHDALLERAEQRLQEEGMNSLLANYGVSGADYERLAHAYLYAGPQDPHYADLLRGFIVSKQPEFSSLWDLLFTQCEYGLVDSVYRNVTASFLEAYSPLNSPMHVLVSGHIGVRGGYQIVNQRHLRLASWAHAYPPQAGCYLLFDAAAPVRDATGLAASVHPAWTATGG
jgi:hypothetical protein